MSTLKVLAFIVALFTVSCPACGQTVTLKNDSLLVEVDKGTANFTIIERITGQVWEPDPWEEAAGLLTLKIDQELQTVNLSSSQSINVDHNDNAVTITFTELMLAGGTLPDASVTLRLSLHPRAAILDAEVVGFREPDGITFDELTFPARHFSLRTGKDYGMGVVPYWQGAVTPSYTFPMRGGRFTLWDDIQHSSKAIGRLGIYGFGLSMPWWGTHTKQSAVVGILGPDLGAEMEYVLNSKGQRKLFSQKNKWSPYPRILALSPVWDLQDDQGEWRISYHFIPGGTHVEMAKRYRNVARERGYLVTLREKAQQNPDVEKLAGALYLGVYGGYPHYVNEPSMAFTFDGLEEMIRTVHDSLDVNHAIIHAWGTFSGYPPQNWPISDSLGGPDELREAVQLAKRYGYLNSSYRSYSPALRHDPDFTMEYLPENEHGEKVIGGRWGANDPKYFEQLARESLPKEIGIVGQNADITDIGFVSTDHAADRIQLAQYIRSQDLVMGTERGQEIYIPYFDFFEGLANTFYPPTQGRRLNRMMIRAPLFNLVYHDAVATYGKIQDPDNNIATEGDFRIKSLRNLLHGSGTLLFFAPHQFAGVKRLIRLARKVVAPVHRESFYAELVDHKYLSPDFKLQRSRFSNGVKVTVNFSRSAKVTPSGIRVPGYGYRVRYSGGKIEEGHFRLGFVR